MITLEKLYNCAAKHLTDKDKNWVDFAIDIKQIFNASVILYRIKFSPDGAVSLFDPICSSDPKIVKKYIDQKMYEYHPMAESDMPSLEPDRRTDVMTDAEFRNIGSYADMMIELGIFYLMVVPAKLPNGEFIALVSWRDEKSGDFTDIEKQRIALFMRHLLVFVGTQEFLLHEPEIALIQFGKKYNLTDTEVQILSDLLQGQPLKAIAKNTQRAYGTVRWHVQNILTKCQVSTQKDLLREFYLLIKN